jgi:hypothetical protein
MKPMKHESRGKVRAKWPWLLGLAALLITAMLVLVMFKSAQSGRSKGLNPLARLLFGLNEEVFGQVVSAKQVGVLSAGATVSTGDGLNFLKLSNAQIAMLKGKGFAEIEASFGKPTAVRESQPLKMLNYSDASAPGKNYRKRIIGINAEGKVAEVDDGYEFRD